MNKIDTEYKSLADVPPAVAQHYSEETRARVVGYEEPDEEGYCKPVTEPYTVVVLNKPDMVLYSEVAQRIGERKSREVVNTELDRAIEWEEFYYSHDLMLEHEADYALWEQEQPTEIVDEEEVLLPAPEPPVIDMTNRREYYLEVTTPYDTNLFTSAGTTIEFDDVAYTATTINLLEDKPAEVVSAYHQELAIQARYAAIYGVLLISKGLIDIGIGKDGVKGITNLTNTLDAIALGMDSSGGVMWIMADNVATLLQREDIEEAVVKFNARKQAVFTAYGEWRSGDMQSPFIVGGMDA
ncbi:hypothetical protein VPDG_00120 [Vibrio phage henriette 12B8]|uniref:hypothetical protein n=1 Tax=Vibrio phage henriette 12B8 TaxID=573174 RepID=UPI0002C0E449|nr:hypothetical protein VPDG_00120 [Vibrio phage henriette 12B8]AGG58281.1 hypothetical protein VPDG_00120 [Vibrio phage henriette 12B8]